MEPDDSGAEDKKIPMMQSSSSTTEYIAVTSSNYIPNKMYVSTVPSGQDIVDRLESIEKRLAIVSPDVELMEKYPSLQEAYDHYKLVEKLVQDQKK